jgi:ABC-type multidrug transport system fused ATPase/permease subunit
LVNALRAAGLDSLQEDTGEGKITLDSAVASGGSNFSVGQRQIIALARAIVRDSKLLILDEGKKRALPHSLGYLLTVGAATSAIDYKTDNVIQTSLRQELKKDVTVITVAHRLQTIMDADRIVSHTCLSRQLSLTTSWCCADGS